MKKRSLGSACVLLLCWLMSACGPQKGPELVEGQADSSFVTPAEFDPQEAVWMGWPCYENKRGWDTKALHLQLWAAMAPHVLVHVAVNPTDTARGYDYATQVAEIDSLIRLHGIDRSRIRLFAVPHDDVWWRDMGPIFLHNARGERAVADFGFNVWGYESPQSPMARLEGAADTAAAKAVGVNKVLKTTLISEGGNRELNGRGTLLAVEPVERHRNPHLSLPQIEAELKRVLGVRKVIWLPWGRYDDELSFRPCLPGPDGEMNAYTVIATGGHIDEHVRFAGPSTILYTQVSEQEARHDSIAAENKRRMEANLAVLRAATDQDGQVFELIPMPSAPVVYETLQPGDGVYDYLATNDSMLRHNPLPTGKSVKVILATSYLNFLITNGLILGQKYYYPGAPVAWKALDEEAQATLQRAFPGRKVLLFDARAINIGGGGIHCNTQQQPALPTQPAATTPR